MLGHWYQSYSEEQEVVAFFVDSMHPDLCTPCGRIVYQLAAYAEGRCFKSLSQEQEVIAFFVYSMLSATCTKSGRLVQQPATYGEGHWFKFHSTGAKVVRFSLILFVCTQILSHIVVDWSSKLSPPPRMWLIQIPLRGTKNCYV